MTEAVGLDKDRGLAHVSAFWDPHEDFHIGGVSGVIPDLLAGIYGELGVGRDFADGWELRLDGQYTRQWDVGEDLLGDLLDDA